MKKFLKVFIIVLLVLAVIGGTVYFFFRKIEERNNNTGSIVAMLESESKLTYNANLVMMNELVNIDGTDDRIELIIKTNENLDEIVYVLATYYVDSNTSIDNEQISNMFKQVNASRSLISRMMLEYNLKKESTYFNRHTGANDFYEQCCVYLTQYATFANLLNDNIRNVNKSSDLKFSMFEIYSNVVISTFNNRKLENSKIIIDYANNIETINEYFEVGNSYVLTQTSQFSSCVNQFNKFYNKCNATLFAEDLAFNIGMVTTSDQNTNEEIATYYFKLIYGI